MLATRSAVLALAFLCLVACGGGGGGGTTAPPAPPPPPPPSTNAAPAFGTLAFSGTEESDVTGNVSATDPDGDTLTFAKTGDPAHGQIMQFQATGAFTYRPAANFAGTDTFAVRVTDTANHQTNGTATITVANVNDAPTIVDQVLTVSAANPVVDVLANNPDPDGEALTLTVETPPLFNVGASVVNGRVQLSLPPNFAGFTRFTYRAVDGAGLGGVATALVFVDAQPVRIIYETNEENDRLNLYVHDLIGQARRVSNFAALDPTNLGRIRESANGRTIVYEETFSDVNGTLLTYALWAAPLDGSDVARQITAPLQTGEKLALRSAVSPDGNWFVYSVTDAGNNETLFLKDLRPGAGPAVVLAKPAGAMKIEVDQFTNVLFGPSSQFIYYSARFGFGGSNIGHAIYRASVNSPGTPQRLSAAAVANRFTGVSHIAPNDSSVVVLTNTLQPSSRKLERIDTVNPGISVTLSHALGTSEEIGPTVVDEAFNRVAYMVVKFVTPAEYALYLADISQAASGTLVAPMVTDGPASPYIFSMHPSGDALLMTSSVANGSGSFDEEVSEIKLPSGVKQRIIARQGTSPVFNYIPDAAGAPGAAIAYEDPATGILSAPRAAPTNTQVHFPVRPFSYQWSPDGNILAAITSVFHATDPMHLHVLNRTSTADVQLTGLVVPTSVTLEIHVVPRN
jgi:hypothetical protein